MPWAPSDFPPDLHASMTSLRALAGQGPIDRDRLLQAWLERLDYGNREIGTVVDRFWLDGPLKISAVEQAKFVARLAQGKLDASAEAQAQVREILRVEESDGAILFGKTGWDQKVGWWTGWVEREDKIFAFSLNMPMEKLADAPKRIEIGKALLAKLGVL